MFPRILSFAFSLSLFTLWSCDRPTEPRLASASQEMSRDGSSIARLRVDFGSVGHLAARAAQISPRRIEIVFSRTNEQGVVVDRIADTIGISGTGSWSKEYRLTASPLWSVAARVVDDREMEIFAGIAAFSVAQGFVVDVPLNLAARYSEAHIPLRILDSMTRFVVKVNGTIQADCTFVKQTRVGETVYLDVDHIPASTPLGTVNLLEILVEGEQWGRTWTLYRMQDTIRTISGTYQRFNLPLSWVGPAAPPPTGAKLSLNIWMGFVSITSDYRGIPSSDGSVTDPRSGFVYPFKRFGDQVWMLRNIGPECIETDRCPGILFKDTAMVMPPPGMNGPMNPMNPDYRNACPTGWHIPDTSEWHTLVQFAAAGESDAVGSYHLRSAVGWHARHPIESDNPYEFTEFVSNGDDQYGFGIYPTQTFLNGYTAFTWSEAEMWTSTPGCRIVLFNAGGFTGCRDFHYDYYMSNYLAAGVRCIKDAE